MMRRAFDNLQGKDLEDTVMDCLERGANVDDNGDFRGFPVLSACVSVKLLKEMIKRGANLRYKEYHTDWTILHNAEEDYLPGFEYILENKLADTKRKASRGVRH